MPRQLPEDIVKESFLTWVQLLKESESETGIASYTRPSALIGVRFEFTPTSHGPYNEFQPAIAGEITAVAGWTRNSMSFEVSNKRIGDFKIYSIDFYTNNNSGWVLHYVAYSDGRSNPTKRIAGQMKLFLKP